MYDISSLRVNRHSHSSVRSDCSTTAGSAPQPLLATSPTYLPSSFKICSIILPLHSAITTHHHYYNKTVYTKVFQRSVFCISRLMY